MSEFIVSSEGEPHLIRRKALFKKYPREIREIMGNEPTTALWIVGAVALQYAMAYFVRDQSFLLTWVLAFCIGAFVNHALYVFVHEATHNLVFKHSVANRLIGIFCDFALGVPSAMAFRKYHLMHHVKQGERDYDADLAPEHEARWVGNSTFRKLIWVFFLAVSQGLRPNHLKKQKFMDPWIAFNLVVQICAIAVAYQFVGGMGLFYLGASTFIGLGLHPMGGRWIAEHFVIREDQETYSYYGPLNRLAFNVGYHNEHHDVMTIAWQNLPKLKQIAPEFYAPLKTHDSYVKLLIRFICDPTMSLSSRVIRPSRTLAVATPEADVATASVAEAQV